MTANLRMTETLKMENYWKNWKPDATRSTRRMETASRMDNSSRLENSSMMEERVEKTSFKKLEDIKLIEFVENIVDFDRNNVRSCDNCC